MAPSSSERIPGYFEGTPIRLWLNRSIYIQFDVSFWYSAEVFLGHGEDVRLEGREGNVCWSVLEIVDGVGAPGHCYFRCRHGLGLGWWALLEVHGSPSREAKAAGRRESCKGTRLLLKTRELRIGNIAESDSEDHVGRENILLDYAI